MESVLVTGAAGFIATHVISALNAERKYKIRGTVRDVNDSSKVAPLRALFPDLELVAVDLQSKHGWKEAVEGCAYVFHVASPFPSKLPRNEEELIRPAVDGVQHVLDACNDDESTVKRLIVTGSTTSISSGVSGSADRVYTEDDWTDFEKFNVSAYDKSKTLAERRAWDFVKESERKFDLVVINPSIVIGPLLLPKPSNSHEVVRFMLKRDYPGLPNVAMPLVDVRDVAAAHLAAMTSEKVCGKRVIVFTESLWAREVAAFLKDEFESQGYRIPQRTFPNFVIWMAKLFDSSLEYVYPGLGKKFDFNNQRMVEDLGIKPSSIRDSIIDTAYSLIEMGMVEKKPGFRSRKN